MRSVVRWLVGALLVGVAVVGVGPAHAERWSGTDPSGDVRLYDFTRADEDLITSTAAPRHRRIDLTRYVVRYGPQRVSVVMRFRELDRRDPILTVQARFRWPSGPQLDYGEATVTADRAHRSGRAGFSTVAGCRVRHHLDYTRDRATLSFPARCIGSARWVQVNLAAFTFDRPRPASAHHDGLFPVYDEDGDDGELEQFGPRIHRG